MQSNYDVNNRPNIFHNPDLTPPPLPFTNPTRKYPDESMDITVGIQIIIIFVSVQNSSNHTDHLVDNVDELSILKLETPHLC